MVSFEIKGGLAAVETFVNELQCFTLAESLGGVESLIAHPATMTHASMDEAARTTAGIGDSLLRLSVGIEHSDDLVADLAAALDVALAASERYAGAGGVIDLSSNTSATESSEVPTASSATAT